ncbi:hypothetical protein CHS0354_009071 [Potamilus streckersoni]|uniref:Uncharacterized protein n=1 Tax=Potamilus streckersoni TaxID=2493646 RepID=A0AAE0TJ67_9BIVA|nr:hypothetical protein CHS0354_009071 [Potamilus streckersoni]
MGQTDSDRILPSAIDDLLDLALNLSRKISVKRNLLKESRTQTVHPSQTVPDQIAPSVSCLTFPLQLDIVGRASRRKITDI